jgi:tetratricopeptide (TPR) repeat protein
MNRQMTSCLVVAISLVLLFTASMAQPLIAQTSKGIDLCTAWQFTEAEKVLRAAVKADPGDLQANYWLGIAALMQNKHEEALKLFTKVSADKDNPGRKARATDPGSYEIQIALARARLELKQNAQALKCIDAAQKLRPKGVEVATYRGAYYLNMKNVQKAVAELEKAISLGKQDAYAHYYMGLAYLNAGNPAQAKEMLTIFIQLAPLAPEAVAAKAIIDSLC